ncbi:serine/threonine protein kinase [Nocardia sp. 2]|uniref:non-specific serine/threonine protein kinase n=1 Tax=Nocardia acididurans TaxID=2802282 RepID=A0ABS1MI38_9NOCA|nr:serine/threonine-protein kinase [Nocardia acididurans]MBL1080330.1 serine/threonine protein kinase [Nocardia acididurans]
MIDLQPGTVFAGYTIERRLGAGGWGTVYLARDPQFERRFTALKLLNRGASDNESQQRFLREGDLVAQLEHPNIVTVFNRGVEGEILWISMQYVPGADASVLAGIPADQAVRIGAEVAAALDHAHHQGVLHRDVKPANILLGEPVDGRPGRVLLTDFGIARRQHDDAGLTRAGSVNGTAAFIAPEQVSGGTVGPWSDQYSLACTLFQLVTDEPVYAAREFEALIFAHVEGTPRLVSDFRPDLRALDPVLARALAKNPVERFGNCTEFVAAAAQALRGGRIAGAVAPLPSPRPPLEATMPAPVAAGSNKGPYRDDPTAAAPVAAARRGRRRTTVLLGLAASVLVGIGAVVTVPMALRQNADPATSPVDPSSYAGARAVTTFDHLLPTTTANLGYENARCVRRNEIVDPVLGKSGYQIDCTQPDGLNFVIFDYLSADSAARQLRDVYQGEQPSTTALNGTDDHEAFYTVHMVEGDMRVRMGFATAPWSEFTIEITWPGHAAEYLIDWAERAPL